METYNWYSTLIKPTWAPPSWIFSPVWTVLYIIIAITFARVFSLWLKKKIPFTVLLPFILNLVFNFAFSPIQFKLQNNLLASIDVLLVLFTLLWAMIAIFKTSRFVALANMPYLLWVSFASVLQITITILNL